MSETLFSKTQRRVLGLLFGHPERSYYANEIVRFAGAGVGAVHRELQALAAAGLVTVSRVGNQKHYRANRDSPIFEELHSMVSKVLAPGGHTAAVLEQPRAQYGAGAACSMRADARDAGYLWDMLEAARETSMSTCPRPPALNEK